MKRAVLSLAAISMLILLTACGKKGATPDCEQAMGIIIVNDRGPWGKKRGRPRLQGRRRRRYDRGRGDNRPRAFPPTEPQLSGASVAQRRLARVERIAKWKYPHLCAISYLVKKAAGCYAKKTVPAYAVAQRRKGGSHVADHQTGIGGIP